MLDELSGEIKIPREAIKPRKTAGLRPLGEKSIMVYPEPVSCMVCFEQFVLPALLKKMGTNPLFRSRV